jgi:antimicrobial peptide system SdpB family protein
MNPSVKAVLNLARTSGRAVKDRAKILAFTVEYVNPAGKVAALARSVLALGTFLTIALTPSSVLFYRSETLPDGIACLGVVAEASLFCVAPPHDSAIAKAVALVVLGLAAAGLFPGVVTWAHAWVAWSLYTTSPGPDGGDHVAGMMSLIFILLYLGDARITHWQTPRSARPRSIILQVIRHTSRPLFCAQAIILYGQAFIGKLGVQEWLNGTDFWYWIQDGPFVPPEPLNGIYRWMSSTLVGSIAINYGSLVLEATLMMAFLFAVRYKARLWIVAVGFHVAIAVTFGLWSFFCSMAALLTMYLLEPGSIYLAGQALKPGTEEADAGGPDRKRSAEKASGSPLTATNAGI